MLTDALFRSLERMEMQMIVVFAGYPWQCHPTVYKYDWRFRKMLSSSISLYIISVGCFCFRSEPATQIVRHHRQWLWSWVPKHSWCAVILNVSFAHFSMENVRSWMDHNSYLADDDDRNNFRCWYLSLRSWFTPSICTLFHKKACSRSVYWVHTILSWWLWCNDPGTFLNVGKQFNEFFKPLYR